MAASSRSAQSASEGAFSAGGPFPPPFGMASPAPWPVRPGTELRRVTEGDRNDWCYADRRLWNGAARGAGGGGGV